VGYGAGKDSKESPMKESRKRAETLKKELKEQKYRYAKETNVCQRYLKGTKTILKEPKVS